MVDKPGPTNTGPYTVQTWTEQYSTIITGTPYITINTPGVYYGIRYWAQVRISVPGVIFKECWFAGPDPDSYTSIEGAIRSFGANPPLYEVWDSIIDPSPWLQSFAPGGARSSLNRYSLGIHGGQFRLYRTEIVNVQDGINHIGPSTEGPALVAETLMQQCWLHKGYYENNVYPPSDGQPHADGFQFNYGRNITLRGNTIGGTRVASGYNVWPGGYNAGDDFWNAAIMMNQEVGVDETRRICNVLIEGNWLGGGTASINHYYDPARPNLWDDNCFVRDNKFLTRGSDWGQTMKGDGLDQPGYTNTTGAGWYIMRNSKFASIYSGNINEQTGDPVSIVNG